MTERMIEVGGVALCTEPFGDPADPAVVLVMGVGGSMLWWDEGFCRLLADAGRYVIRFDHRDTGRSTTYEPGRPGYTGADMAGDVMRVLDAYGLEAAHLFGLSAGGAIAQVLALDHPDRVLSLVLMSTSPGTPGDRDLPPPTAAFGEFVSTAAVDWADPGSVVECLVGYSRLLHGDRRPFDEARQRAQVQREVERSNDIAALQNHDALTDDDREYPPLSAVAVPTLVIHGTADPLFPPGHGAAVAAEIPGARLVLLDGAGHAVDPADWKTIAAAVIADTSPAR